MDEGEEYLPSQFYYSEDLETSGVETETGISESQEVIDDLYINKQKSADTNKRTTSYMSTVLRYMEANGMTKTLPASEFDHLLSNFFLNTRRKNGEEYELETSSTFYRTRQRYLTENRYPFNILKDNI